MVRPTREAHRAGSAHAAARDAARRADARQGGARHPESARRTSRSGTASARWCSGTATRWRSGSRNERPMTRYFPELVEAFRPSCRSGACSTARSSWPRDGRLEFEVLQQRIHPADSRVRAAGRRDPGVVRRVRPARAGRRGPDRPAVHRAAGARWSRRWAARGRRCTSPGDDGHRGGPRWFEEFEGAGWTASWPSRSTVTYQPDKRVMFKIKHARTADCVVAGYRLHKSGPDLIGSLMLGLYTDDGSLASVGVIGAFPMARRRSAVRRAAAAGHDRSTGIRGTGLGAQQDPEAARNPGRRRPRGGTPARTCRSCRCGPSSWSRSRYDQMEGARFRHTAQFNRWRPDRTPRVVHLRPARAAGAVRPCQRAELTRRPAPRPAGQTVRRRGGPNSWLVGHC